VLAAIAATTAAAASSPDASATPRVHVPAPDLSRFNLLWGASDSADESKDDSLNISCHDHAPEVPVSVFFA
jgi:hypothetical protein